MYGAGSPSSLGVQGKLSREARTAVTCGAARVNRADPKKKRGKIQVGNSRTKRGQLSTRFDSFPLLLFQNSLNKSARVSAAVD